MDHRDIAARLARRFVNADREESLRTTSEREVLATVRDRVAAGAFEGALMELAHSSTEKSPDYEELVEDIQMVLEEELAVTAKRTAHLAAAQMDRPMTSGQGHVLMNGDYEGEMYTSWEITPPEKIVFRKAIRTKVTALAALFLKNRDIIRMRLKKDAIVSFFRAPAVQQWLSRKWADAAVEATHEIKAPLSLYNSADEAAYENTEEEISCTVYTEDGDEEVPCGLINYTIHLDEPVWRVLKAEATGGNLIMSLEASFKTRGPYRVDLS